MRPRQGRDIWHTATISDSDRSHISESDFSKPLQVHRHTKSMTYPTRSHHRIHRYKSHIDINNQTSRRVRVSLTNEAPAIMRPSRGLGALIHLHLPHNHLISHPQILYLLLNVPSMCLLLFSQLQK